MIHGVTLAKGKKEEEKLGVFLVLSSSNNCCKCIEKTS